MIGSEFVTSCDVVTTNVRLFVINRELVTMAESVTFKDRVVVTRSESVTLSELVTISDIVNEIVLVAMQFLPWWYLSQIHTHEG